MNALPQIYNYQDKQIRTVIKDGEPWFVAKDVCEVLDIDPTQTRRLPEGMKGLRSIQTPGGEQQAGIISESGLYKLAFTSRKPEAERFADWVATEVLPDIRKHGMYISDSLFDSPDHLLELTQRYVEEKKARHLAEQKLIEQKPLVDFAETCIASNDCIIIREVAKVACKQGVNIGEKRLYEKLRRWGLIMPFPSKEPYQRYLDKGYFEISQGAYQTPYGTQTYRYPKVTPKGQVYIIERLKCEACS